MPSGKWRPFCLGLNVLTITVLNSEYSGETITLPSHYRINADPNLIPYNLAPMS